MVQIYCGDGKGKTTAAVGLAIRALGSGKRVFFVQFFKNGDSAEISLLKAQPGLTYLKNEQPCRLFAQMSAQEKAEANEGFHAVLREAIARSGDYDMVVLDEAISCYYYNFLDREALCQFCAQGSQSMTLEIILTGRNPAPELLAQADYVSEIQKVKHPFDAGVKARKGIEF